MIGFVSFEEASYVEEENMFCAHVSTLRDDSLHAAMQEAEESGATASAPRPPILAYALAVKYTGKAEGEYSRIGMAEVNYEWRIAGSEKVVRLVQRMLLAIFGL